MGIEHSADRQRRLKGDGLEKLHYPVACLVRDCMAVVLQRKRKSEAAIRKGQYYYSSERPDQMLTYSIHIERAFECASADTGMKIASVCEGNVIVGM